MPWTFEDAAPMIGTITEGNCWTGSHMLYSNIALDRIMRLDVESGLVDVFAENTEGTNGLNYDADGNQIPGTRTGQGGSFSNPRLYFTPSEDGTYFVSAGTNRAWAWDPWVARYRWVSEEGTYTVSVSELTDDYPASTSTSGVVSVNGWAAGEVERSGDRDWFATHLVANWTYLIHQETSFLPDRPALRREYIYGIHREDGSLIPDTSDDYHGRSAPYAQVRFTPDTTGLYYVSASGTEWGEGTYRLTVLDITGDLPESIGTTGQVSVDGSVTGEIDYRRDQDWFAVELEAGTLYRIELDPSSHAGNGLSRPAISGIFDSNGDSVGGIFGGSNPIDGFEDCVPVVTFRPSESGTYYLAAGALRDDTGGYVFRVTDAEASDTHTAGTDTQGRVSVDRHVTGEIDYFGDVDWFAVELEADTAYRVKLFPGLTPFGFVPSSPERGDVYYPKLRGIYDSAGGLQPNTERPTWVNSYPDVTFTPDTSGTYYVAAGGGNLGGAVPARMMAVYGGFPPLADHYQVGTYTLWVDEI